tara:strand:+ start:611 stop:1108 length:498 start_codon:yes stop_codon:yes gene_type:complete
MTSKAQAKRNKRAQPKAADQERPIAREKPTAQPTPERLARGSWASPDSKAGCAYVDMACDMIGRLTVSGQITQQQAQSARTFSDVYAAYREEIGISESKSCLAVSSGGFDPSDGNEATYKRYYAMRDKIGRVKVSLLQTECAKDADDKPNSLAALRNALDCLGDA